MRKTTLGAVGLVLLGGLVVVGAAAVPAQQQTPAIITGNYLYIEEFEIAPGQVPNEAVAEISEWVGIMRETGEFKSVKLYMHNTGPRFALYILAEPNSWQAIETGYEKLFEAIPDLMDRPYKFGKHSDNLLSEIPVN
jgi:hypothetical protein